MKIKKFNEILSPPKSFASSKAIEYADNFNGAVDDPSVFHWIDTVSQPGEKIISLPEYINILSPDFFKDKDETKFKVYKEYLTNEIDINKMENLIIDLRNRNKEIYFEAVSEVLYNFQQDLIEKDFDGFYTLFVDGYEAPEYDIHPDIMRRYKGVINTRIEAKKYNL